MHVLDNDSVDVTSSLLEPACGRKVIVPTSTRSQGQYTSLVPKEYLRVVSRDLT